MSVARNYSSNLESCFSGSFRKRLATICARQAVARYPCAGPSESLPWCGTSAILLRQHSIDDLHDEALLSTRQVPLPPERHLYGQTGYPAYEVIAIDGITEIVEHRKMEPIFYLSDDPAIRRSLAAAK